LPLSAGSRIGYSPEEGNRGARNVRYPPRVDRISGLESRVEALEQELLELKRILGSTADGSN